MLNLKCLVVSELFLLLVNICRCDIFDNLNTLNSTKVAKVLRREGLEKNYPAYINFLYYPGETTAEAVFIDIDSVELLVTHPQFVRERKTVLYVAGHNEDYDDALTTFVLTHYLQTSIYNVMQLNWTRYAKEFYFNSVMDLEKIGAIVSSKLDYLIEVNSLDIDQFELAGHSLGAQLVGVIGRSSKMRYPFIIGLDPAAPGFYLLEEHLSQTDARFVAAIHTDGGFYGTTLNDVHLNIYPNSGTRYQPGCTLMSADVCSHVRSVYLWGFALTDPEMFIARQCDNYLKFSNGLCINAITTQIGPTVRNVTGKFFLRTDDKPPYGLGIDGT